MFDFLIEKSISEQIYFYFGLFGATISVIFTLLMLIGLLEEVGFDIDMDGEVGCDCDLFGSTIIPFRFFTIRGFVAGISFFGWAGYLYDNIFIALATGIVTYLLIGFVYFSSRKLQQQGNYFLSDTIGKEGTVYMRVKGDLNSIGKVHLFVASGLKELYAISDEDLEYGERVIVHDILDGKLIVKKVEG